MINRVHKMIKQVNKTTNIEEKNRAIFIL